MNYLIVALGSVGDVNPSIAVALALKQRGHRVTFITNPYFGKLVRASGLELVELGSASEFEEYLANPGMWSQWRFWKVSMDYCALRPMRQLYDLLRERYVPGETVVAAPPWAFGARLAQEKLGMPLATLILEPYLVRSLIRTAVMPPPMIVGPWVTQGTKRMQFWVADRLVTDAFLAPRTNAFRRELGLPPVNRIMGQWWHSPQRIIGLYPDWFVPPQADWPPQTRLTGFPLWDQTGLVEVPKRVADYLDAGDPPIVFTPGTVNQHAMAYFKAAADGCRLLGRRGMLITKHPEQLPENLAPGVEHFDYVPFSYLLPRAAALVHHAGTGTTALCLAAGIPHVLTPMSFSQPDIAARLERLGVGKSVGGKPTGRLLARAISKLLASAEVKRRCADLAARFKGMQPIEDTCDLLEKLVGSDMNRRATELVH